MGGDGIVAEAARAETPEDRIRLRLRELSDAAGVALPRLEVVEASSWRPPAWVRAGRTVVAAVTLSTAPPAERDWHLAAALTRWASRRVRARHRLIYALGLAWLVLGVVVSFGSVLEPLPPWAEKTVLLVLLELGHLARCWLDRHHQRAVDDAAAEILSAAGLDPAAVARAALGDEPAPAWWKRPFARTPAPQERIAAAERPGLRPAAPLH